MKNLRNARKMAHRFNINAEVRREAARFTQVQSQLPKKLVFILAGPEEHATSFWDRAVVSNGLEKHALIGSGQWLPRDLPHPDDEITSVERFREIVAGNESRAFHLKEPVMTFMDLELSRPNPSPPPQNEWWLDRKKFTKADQQVCRNAIEACRMALPSTPTTMYALPWTARGDAQRTKRDWRKMRSARWCLSDAQYIWHSAYPHEGFDGDMNMERRRNLMINQHQHLEFMRKLLPNKPIVPALFPTFKQVDRRNHTKVIVDTLAQFPEIRTMAVWVNPHSRTMSLVYGDKFNDMLPELERWLAA